MDLSGWIERNAGFHGERPAIKFQGETISYRELEQRVLRLAALLRHEFDIRQGDRVAHIGYNSPEIIDLYFACARLGAILVPLNWRLAAPELEFIIQNSSPKVLLADAAFRPTIDIIRRRIPNCACIGYGPQEKNWENYSDLIGTVGENFMFEEASPEIGLHCPFLIVYTSGTTGRPKGAVLSQNAVTWNAVNSTHLHDMTSTDKVLNFLPMFHVGGLNIQTSPALHAGACVIIQDKFDPGETLRLIREERPTLLVNVPATMQAMLEHPDWEKTDFSCFRVVVTGSTNVPEPIIRTYQERGIPVGQVYGSSETAPIAIGLRGEDGARKMGSTGKPVLHCEIKLIDKNNATPPTGQPGEILVKGPNVLTEYWNNPEETAAAFQGDWFRTGDIAYRDGDGFFWIVDREKDLIISGSENIYPAELEAILAEHPDIREAAVVARADEKWGEIPVAVVALKQGSSLNKDEILQLFEGQLARYKHPRDVVFVDILPRNVMGKILKYKLRETLAE